MFALLLSLVVTAPSAEPRQVDDPRGFHFTVPAGFEPFPGFQPTATRLYAFGKNLGTPEAVILALDVVDGPLTAGAPSRSCGALMNSIDRTVGKPITEPWQGAELSGLRMLMTQIFGEIVVYCVDVPVLPSALSLKVSGKPTNEALLHDTFQSVLASLETPRSQSFPVFPVVTGIVAGAFLALGWWTRSRRRRAALGR